MSMASSASHSASSRLVALRLTPEQYHKSVAQARTPRYPYHSSNIDDIDPSKKQAIVVRGYNADAVEAIKTATGGGADVVNALYIVGRDLVRVG